MLDTRKDPARQRADASCDQCRQRKIRCLPGSPMCEPCGKRGQQCTFEYTRKKAGRPRRSGASSWSMSSPQRDVVDPSQLGIDSQLIPLHTPTPVQLSPLSVQSGVGVGLSSTPVGSIDQSLGFDNTIPNLFPVEQDLTVSFDAAVVPPVTTNYGFESGKIDNIESLASWADIGYFLSLFMRYQHVLVPLVHRPTFAQDLLFRRDERDEAFRGLLLSMVAYTICQIPATILLERMDGSRLEELLRRCQRASRIIQLRYQSRPSMVVLASTILDWITCQGSGAVQSERPDLLMSDVRRLVFTLKVNKAESETRTNEVDIEIARRLYWEANAIDITNALGGCPVALHPAEGIPPFPKDVEDEFIGMAPRGGLTSLTGFIINSRLFLVLTNCLWRRRVWEATPEDAPANLAGWIEGAFNQLETIVGGVPSELRPGVSQDTPATAGYAIQAANIAMTALCTELALLEFQCVLGGTDVSDKRRAAAQKTFGELEKIPLKCLASNGESMRGKVLHVLLGLLSDSQDAFSQQVVKWCEMYSKIQFIQVIPIGPVSAVPTRPPTPV